MDLPHTFDAWEKRLVNYFLAIGPDGDASPIRAFEVTPHTLTMACSASRGSEDDVEMAFRLMLSRDPLLMESLRSGSQRYEKPDVPNCFSYLVFTLLIDSLLEGNSTHSGAFRHKLVKWLGIDTTVSNLRGVALMWESLVRWLNERIQEGEPLRRLILPDHPPGWNHIGYTLRLSFPSRTDLRLVAHFCQEYPDAHRDPRVSISAFPRQLGDRASWGLRRAFNEFRGAYYMQRRALSDLPFWHLLKRAATLPGSPTCHNVTVEMLFDADKCAIFFANRDEEGEAEPFISLNDALIAVGAEYSENLATAAEFGIVFFHLVSAGRWQATSVADNTVFGLHVAFAERHKQKIGDRLGVLVDSDAWAITTQPLPLETIKDALREAKLLSPKQEQIVRPCLSGGVRSDGVWLGRPRFLPSIKSDTDHYVTHSALLCETGNPLRIDHGQLKASQPIEGAFFIHPTLLRGEMHAPWSIRLQFISNAFPHMGLKSARYQLPLLRDWMPGTSAHLEVCTQDKLEWESEELACADLLEAVYASGRRGWEEAQIIALLRCSDEAMNPWLLLQSLRDAGIIEPRLRSGWKGRVWTLKEPCIIEAHRGGLVFALVEGALCSRMTEDFKLAVEGLGGTPFRRLGITPWAAPLIGAQDVPVKVLAERLGWRFEAETPTPSAQSLAFAETRHQALFYEPSDVWSWSAGRFIRGEGAKEGVQLLRLAHTGGRDHDVYRVEQNGYSVHYLSRTAAIASAHAQAKTPLFEWNPEEETIVVREHEGGLPDALATELRRCMLRNGGPRGPEYVYPANAEMVRWLARQLPDCIAGLPKKAQLDAPSLIDFARRSSGRLRLQWRNGSAIL
ncbi:hypothetical protein [Aquitalea sp. ASV11]|uniref:hypothetical protein n=1 Tax=Aquitalea sp. ASV11 TaxID=2795103 RepID=UPI0018EBCC45|nr:hypothetical protein [Aquitalea sp. ASV11]